jgi:lysophospholipid acyltransferase (LPLAT)-like uncharacterized protein
MVQVVLARLTAAYIHLIDRTGRWELRCPPATVELIRSGQPFIGAFWHGRLLMMLPAWRMVLQAFKIRSTRQTHLISSDHGDGRLMQLTVHCFGVKTLVGSSRRGGAKALRDAKRVLNAGDIVIMTPDGPRGPRMHAQNGIAYLASKAGVPVVPATFATCRQRPFNSWDRFVLVLPFSRGMLVFGDPIHLPADSDLDAARGMIEGRLNSLSAEIDEAVGLEPIRPAG